MSSTPFLERVPLERIDGHDVLLQTGFWGEFKSYFGWSPRAFVIDGRIPLLTMTRAVSRGLSLCYVPHGPLATTTANWNAYYLRCLSEALVAHLPPGCLFVRFDLPWGAEGEGVEPASLSLPFRRASMDIQPPSTVIVDLTASEEELLARMRPKTRYNVRLAEKRGVTLSIGGMDDLEAWYALYRETAARDRIAIHSLVYYRKLFELAAARRASRAGGSSPASRAEAASAARVATSTPAGWLIRSDEAHATETESPPRLVASEHAPVELHLLLARADGELVAGNIVAVHGRRATYLFGASSNAKRNLMGTYLLQWEAMRLAKRRGCRSYDLFGIPFRDDPSDPMFGLYRFKTGFGGTIVNRPGSWDYPLAGALYGAYRLAEGSRRWYYKRFKKRRGTAPGG